MPEYPESISVVIPSYNEAGTIGNILEELQEVLNRLPGVSWEVIVVDDGSSDGTAAEVEKSSCGRLVRHPVNRGYGASLKSGIGSASGEVIITMDADGQHNPTDIARLVEDMESYAMSAGSRAASSGVPLVRRPGKWVLSKVMNYLCRSKIPDINCGFRAIRTEVIKRYLHLCSDRFSFSMSSTLALLSEGHFIRFVEIVCRERQGSVSQVRVFSGFDAFMTLVRLTIVFHPFRVFLPLSLFFWLVGLGSLLYDVFWIFNVTDATILLVVSAMLIMLFGLVSDQIAHVRRELR